MNELKIGRMVHYKTEDGECMPATVVRVHDDGLVALHIFGEGRHLGRFGEIGMGVDEGQWHWPGDCPLGL